MKIKEVSKQTELTSRTIRLYIEEKLISPEYSENYLGRKSYCFSDKDIESLLNIATLRKYGFSISEIRQIIESKNNSARIINDICNRKQKTVQDESEMLSALLELNDGGLYSIDEIAGTLKSYYKKHDLPQDDTMSAFLLLLKNPKQLFIKSVTLADKLLLLISLGISVFFIVYYFLEWKYPHFYDLSLGLLLLFLTSIPTLIILSIWFVTRMIAKRTSKRKAKRGLGLVSIVLVELSILPMCIIGLVRPVESLTTDMTNYRKIDEYESQIYNNGFYNELFPLRPEGEVRKNDKLIYPDSNYYYRCRAVFDFTVDIYAEWSLKEAGFYEEVDRVKKLYSAYEILDEDESDYRYAEMQKGEYTCLVRYDGETPFAEEKEDYYYFIFAYNEEDLRVRYILCYSGENGANQPYYLQLNW